MDLQKAFDLIQQKLSFWLRELVRMLPNLALAALVLVLGIYLSKGVRKLAQKAIGKFSHGAVITNLVSSFIYLICIGISLFAALSILKLDKTVTSILAGAGIAGIALAFAFQDIAANFMSGILITIRKPLRVGDIVKVKDYMGKVTNINLRDTVVQTFQGQMVIIPNKEVQQNPIENYSLLGRRRMDISIGVSYNEDLEKVQQITLDAVATIKGLAPGQATTFFYENFADSSINYTLRLWAASPEQSEYLRVRSEAIMQIKKAYDNAGINIPFPIRTLEWLEKGAPLPVAVGNGINKKAGI